VRSFRAVARSLPAPANEIVYRTIDTILGSAYIPLTPSIEGHFHEVSWNWDGGGACGCASPACPRAAPGTALGVLRPLCEELADDAADRKIRRARKRGPELKHRGNAMPRAAVERREARVPDRNGAQQTARSAGRLRQPLTGPRKPRRFSALRSPRLPPGEKEACAPLRRLGQRGAVGLLRRLTNQLIPMAFSVCGKLRRFPENPEPNVKQRLLGLAPWGRAIGRNTDAPFF
jgi:hypothetical protein